MIRRRGRVRLGAWHRLEIYTGMPQCYPNIKREVNTTSRLGFSFDSCCRIHWKTSLIPLAGPDFQPRRPTHYAEFAAAATVRVTVTDDSHGHGP